MTGGTSNVAAVHELGVRVNELGVRMDKQFDELKEMLLGFEERMRAVENKEAACQPLLAQRIDGLAARQFTQDAEIKALKEVVAEVVHTNRILKWLAGIFTVVATAFLVALITGQVQILFR